VETPADVAETADPDKPAGVAGEGEEERDEAGDNQPLAPAGSTNAATAMAATTPVTTPIRASRRREPGLRCPPGAGGISFELISAGLYWARSHGVLPKVFGQT
jgi:hypothetical protein